MIQKPSHIIFAIHSLQAGGAERVVSILANQLSLNPSYKISIITFTSIQEKPFYFVNKKIDLIHLGDIKNKKKSLLKKAYNIVVGSWKFWKALRTETPDVLVSFIDSMNFLSLVVSRGSGIPVIVSERYDPTTYNKSSIKEPFRRFLYLFASQIIVQSFFIKKFLGNRLSPKIHIIGNPVLKAKKQTNQKVKSKDVKIISVGRLIPSKRMDFLIRAFQDVLKKHSAVQLLICGDGPERSNLETLIKDLKLEKNVTLLGTVKSVEDILVTGQILAFASESEGFPNALCEAMATGLVPVITDYGSSARDIVEDGKNGFVIEKNDMEGFSSQLCLLIEDGNLRNQISKEAQKISDTYNVNHIVNQWEKAISDSMR